MTSGTGGGGYFGKLPARGDFVTGACPAGFLKFWEPFLIEGLAQSRLDLKDAWEEAYMTMPVWRFWIKPENGGKLEEAVAGAFMPSVDRVGRKFPLTVVAPFSSGESETARPAGDWYETVEAILLQTLQEDADLAGFQEAVADLVPPVPASEDNPSAGIPELAALGETGEWVSSGFHCKAGDREYAFACFGLPNAHAFRWFLLPEAFGGAGADEHQEAGSSGGLYHPEDSRT